MAPWLVRVLALVAVVATFATSAGMQAGLNDELVRVGGFTPADVTSLSNGQVIVRVEQGRSDTEVAALAAVRIRASKEQTLSYFNQLISYEDGSVTLQFNNFSRPPAAGDVSRLVLDASDISSLRACRPGNCDIRIGGATMADLQKAVDWKAPDATSRVTEHVRARVFDYVKAYVERGNAALVTYNDRSSPVSLAEQWRGLLANTPAFAHYAPPLQQYADSFPQGTLAGVEDVIYWARENYGLPKPVLHVTHMITWRDPARPDRIVVVQKQIYASHYYDGSLAVTAFLDGPPVDGRPQCVMVYFNRSRGDLLKGGFGGIKRRVAQDQARKAAVQTLTTIRDVLEKG